MNKVVFLDRDGTINVDYGFVHTADKLEFVPGVLDGLKKIYESGFKLIIVSNQSGIGRGIFTQEQYDSFTEHLVDKIKDAGAVVEKVYTCPHSPEENCDCRKPKLGLYEKAIEEFDVDINKSFVVGDRIRDLKVSEKYPIKAVLYDADLEVVNQDEKKSSETPNFEYKRAKSWAEIADYICGIES